MTHNHRALGMKPTTMWASRRLNSNGSVGLNTCAYISPYHFDIQAEYAYDRLQTILTTLMTSFNHMSYSYPVRLVMNEASK